MIESRVPDVYEVVLVACASPILADRGFQVTGQVDTSHEVERCLVRRGVRAENARHLDEVRWDKGPGMEGQLHGDAARYR